MRALRLSSILSIGLLAACSQRPASQGQVPELEAAQREPVGAMLVVHGGQGSPASRSEGPAQAAQAAWTLLEEKGDPKLGVMLAVERLEDDPMFNAGTGANLRLDGSSIQADAAVMDSSGRYGAVAGIDGIRHPVRVADAVADTPHSFLAGPGAQAFADSLELERAELRTKQARAKLGRGYARLFAEDESRRLWSEFDWRAQWNFEGEPPATLEEAQARIEAGVPEGQGDDSMDAVSDTVGAVARSADGRYAAALSTGGTTLALNGRVGDVPLFGAGLYAGPHGAVAATGKGEAITRERVAAQVYALLEEGWEPEAAIRRAIYGISAREGVGVIAVSERGWAALASSQMAWAARADDGLRRADRVVSR